MIRLLNLVVDHNQTCAENGKLCVHVCAYVCVTVCVCVCPCVCVGLSVGLSVCLSVCKSAYVFVCLSSFLFLSSDDEEEEDESQLAQEEIQESLSIMTKPSEKVVLKKGIVEKKGHSAAFLMWPKLARVFV